MELKNMKQKETQRMDSETNSWFTSTNQRQISDYCVYSGFAIIPQNCDYKDETINTTTCKEATMLCEKNMITTEAKSALLIPQSTKQVALAKTQSNIRED